MARKVTIPISDEGDACSQGYVVQYKLDGSVDWTTLFPQPVAGPIVINNLLDDTVYNMRFKRLCCDGQESGWSEINVDTTV